MQDGNKSTCHYCATPITKRSDLGWTHDYGVRSRNYCDKPIPMTPSEEWDSITSRLKDIS